MLVLSSTLYDLPQGDFFFVRVSLSARLIMTNATQKILDESWWHLQEKSALGVISHSVWIQEFMKEFFLLWVRTGYYFFCPLDVTVGQSTKYFGWKLLPLCQVTMGTLALAKVCAVFYFSSHRFNLQNNFSLSTVIILGVQNATVYNDITPDIVHMALGSISEPKIKVKWA